MESDSCYIDVDYFFLYLASAIFGDIITMQVRVKYSGFIVLVIS